MNLFKASKNTLYILTCNLITCIAIYMTLPFLVLYLNKGGTLSATEIGLIVGAIPITSSLLGFLGGIFADRFGAILSVILGLAVASLAYPLYTFVENMVLLVLISITIGIARALIDPAMKTLLSFNSDEIGLDAAFRYRYIGICIGVIVGPAIGVMVAKANMALVFYCTSTSLLLTLCLLSFHRLFGVVTKVDSTQEDHAEEKQANRKAGKSLSVLILAGTLIFLVFSLFEMILPLAISKEIDSATALEVFPALLIFNAIFAIVLQFPANKISSFLSQERLAVIGCVLFSVSFAIFSVGSNSVTILFVATAFFTAGEVLCLPASEILISRVSPEGNKASYFGIAEIRQLGFFFGPVLGGLVIDHLNVSDLFVYSSLMSIVTGIIYMTCIKETKKQLKVPV
ncbi:MFS transporter [Vibrio bivalvicida]|nr:MFS transporter [Vibrio bivalvicida]